MLKSSPLKQKSTYDPWNPGTWSSTIIPTEKKEDEEENKSNEKEKL